MATYLGLIELGGLYKNGVVQNRATKPWRIDSIPTGASGVGDIPDFSTLTDMAQWVIGNTPATAAQKLKWHKIQDGSKTLLIADRNILINASWNDLDAQGYVTGKTITVDGASYKCRLLTGGSNYRSGSDVYSGGTPTTNEWDRFITNEENIVGIPTPSASELNNTQDANDLNGSNNLFWNWYYIYSWAQDTYTGGSASRAIRGFASARCWNSFTASYRRPYYGWRPVLEILDTAPLISDTDRNLGDKYAPFSAVYQVSDSDGDALTVTEKLNTTTLRTLSPAAQNTNLELILDIATWNGLAVNSVNTLAIQATDGKGGTTTRTFTFTKRNLTPGAPISSSPVNTYRTTDKPTFEAVIQSDPENDKQHFSLLIAEDSGFTLNAQEFKTVTDLTGWETVDNSAATAFPAAGIDNTYQGKKIRYKKQTALITGKTYYWKIAAIDATTGVTGTYSSVSSIRVGTTLELRLKTPVITTVAAERVLIKLITNIATDGTLPAVLSVEACNNAADEAPAWESVAAEDYHTFVNKAKTAADWALDIRITVVANDSLGNIEILGLGFAFD